MQSPLCGMRVGENNNWCNLQIHVLHVFVFQIDSVQYTIEHVNFIVMSIKILGQELVRANTFLVVNYKC